LFLDLSQKQTFNVLLFIKIMYYYLLKLFIIKFFLNRSWKN